MLSTLFLVGAFLTQHPAAQQYQQPQYPAQQYPQQYQQPTPNAYQQPAAQYPQQYPAMQQGYPQYPAQYPGMQAMAFPAQKVTKVFFPESADRKPYSVAVAKTNLSCTAPCTLEIPSKKNRIVFQGENRKIEETFTVFGSEMTIQMEREGSKGKLVGGGLLLGFGIPALGGAVFSYTWWAENAHDVDSARITAISLTVATVAMISIGSALIHTGKARINQSIGSAGHAEAESPILDSLQFAVVPTHDGFTAGAGFRF